MKFKVIVAFVLLLFAVAAQADVVNIASTGGGAPQTFSVLSGPDAGLTGDTVAIPKNPAWYGPLAGSSWVSYAQSGEHNAAYYQVTNGTVVSFFDEFTITGNLNWWSGSLMVLADDSTAVYLNGTLLFPESPASAGYPTCAQPEPIGCVAGTLGIVNLTPGLQLGVNTLRFDTAQHAGDSFGLDYAGQVATPEPASLILFGTGLTAVAGILRRRLGK